MEQFSFAFSFPKTNKIVKLKAPQQCRLDASKSAILSIASFIVQHFPFLCPPIQVEAEWPQPKVTFDQPWEGGCYHPYFQLWNDAIIKRVIQNYAVFYDSTLFVDIQLRQQDQKFVNKHSAFEQQETEQANAKAKVISIFNLPPISFPNKKIAIFAFSSYKKAKGYPFAPRTNTRALFLSMLYNNEQWAIFDILQGQIPSIEQLATFSGLIMPGSFLSVLSMNSCIQQSLQIVDKTLKINPFFRVLGVCYGHQAICKYNKSQVVKKVRKGGIQTININQQVTKKFQFLSPLNGVNTMLLDQHHQDFVTQVPQGFLLLGNSQSCDVQSLVREDGRILSTQFHPQFFVDYTKVCQQRFLYYYNDPTLLSGFYIEESRQIEMKCMQQSQKWLKIFRRYFEGSK